MVSYSVNDIIDFSDFGYSWRFNGHPWGELTDEQKSSILVLSEEACLAVYEHSLMLRQTYPYRVNFQCYHPVSWCSLPDENTIEEEVLTWLSTLPLKPSEEVYINWGSNTAVITSWSLFMQKWDDFWYPFDKVDVFDDSLNWAVLFGPEEEVKYVERNPA